MAIAHLLGHVASDHCGIIEDRLSQVLRVEEFIPFADCQSLSSNLNNNPRTVRSQESPSFFTESMSSSSTVSSEIQDFSLSPAVQNALVTLQPKLPLHTLHHNLSQLSNTITKITTLTTAFPTLNTLLHQATLTTNHLSQKANHLLATFSQSATKNLDDLAIVKDLLHDNLFTPAKTLLEASHTQNTRLATSSHTLALAFEQAAQTVTEALKHALETQSDEQHCRESLQTKSANTHIRLNRARDTYSAATAALTDAETLYTAAETREHAAQIRGNVLHAAHVTAVMASFITTRSSVLAVGMGGMAALAASVDTQVARAREERAVHLRHRNDARDERLASARDVAELTERARLSRREKEVSDAVISGLESCILKLRELAGVMLAAEAFWNDVSDGVGDGYVKMIHAGEDLPQEERQVYWNGHCKGRLGDGVAFWTAVSTVCQHAVCGVGEAQKSLYNNIGVSDILTFSQHNSIMPDMDAIGNVSSTSKDPEGHE